MLRISLKLNRGADLIVILTGMLIKYGINCLNLGWEYERGGEREREREGEMRDER